MGIDNGHWDRPIEDHRYVDTLITNPRLVQTGLDLVSFQHNEYAAARLQLEESLEILREVGDYKIDGRLERFFHAAFAKLSVKLIL